MLLSITQQDIDNANAALKIRGNWISLTCPLAQALKRTTGYAWSVGPSTAGPEDCHFPDRELTSAARRVIRQFDEGSAIPQTIEIFSEKI